MDIEFKNGSKISTLKNKGNVYRSAGFFVGIDMGKSNSDSTYLRWHASNGVQHEGCVVGYKNDYPVVKCVDGKLRVCDI